MNQSEIESLIKRAKAGDKNSMQILIDNYKAYIYSIIKNYNIKNHTLNDLYQIGCIAIIKAVKKYKSNSHSFSSYVYKSICNEIRFLARSNKKHNKNVSYNSMINNTNNEYEVFMKDDLNILDDFIKNESIEKLKKCILELPPFEREFIKYIYYENHSLTQYSKQYNMSYNKVIRLKNKILSDLKINLKK